ncbi:MAG: hypothetical protein OEW05_01015 [Candidatus Aminicenantes bacterium]|nr:hypothetical protein [Candidatus Aminicenantes bacterium]
MNPHRTWRNLAQGLAVSTCLALLATSGASMAGRPGQVDDQAAFLAKVDQRVSSYPEYKSWEAAVVSRQTEMDKNWRPQTVTVVSKTVRLADGVYEEEIGQALETKRGKSKDVTAEFRAEAREDAEKARRRRAETDRAGGGERRTMSFAIKDILPFGAERMARYDFTFLVDGAPDRPGAVVIQARLKEVFRGKDAASPARENEEEEAASREDNRRQKFNWEGTFVIDPATHDLLRLDVRPAGKIRFVKRMELAVDFILLDGGQLVPTRIKTAIEAGFFLKHVRMEVEEEYSDYRILD